MPSAWVLQLIGWTLVAALDFAMNRAAAPSGDLGWAVYEALSLAAGGLVVSSILLLVQRRAPPGARRAVALAAGGVLAGSAVWYVALQVLDRAVGNPYRTTLAEGLFGRGMLLIFILLAWQGAVDGLRINETIYDFEPFGTEEVAAAP